MKITSLEKKKKIRMQLEGARGVHKQVPISREDGAPTFSFRVFTIEPGGHTPFHDHPFEHENYIIEGHGVIAVERGEREIKKGDFVFVPPGERHQYKNKSRTDSFVMICAVPRDYE